MAPANYNYLKYRETHLRNAKRFREQNKELVNARNRASYRKHRDARCANNRANKQRYKLDSTKYDINDYFYIDQPVPEASEVDRT